jgi:polar amino acid transport system substrate-binding protein
MGGIQRVVSVIGVWLLPLWLCSSTSLAQQLNELIYLTENAPPTNYLDNGQLVGTAVEILEAATLAAGSPVRRSQVQVLPWARAYREAIIGPRRVIFAIYRTPEREKLFKWAGPYEQSRLVLVAKKRRNISLSNLEDLNHFIVGAQREDAAEIYLRKLEFGDMVLTLTVSPLQLARMIVSDRIDIWAGGEDGIYAHLAKIDANPNDFEVVGTLHKSDLYFAFSRDVDDALVHLFQRALDEVAQQRAPSAPPSRSPH